MALRFLSDKYKKKIEILADFLQSNLSVSVKDFAMKHYGPEKGSFFVRMLNDEMTEADHNELQEKLGAMKHLRDGRTPGEYAVDLIMGWIIEDAILLIFESFGYEIILSSADRTREFLKRPKATADYAIKDKKSGKTFAVELAKDYTGFWKKTGKIQLRDHKYENLVKENGLLLGLDFLNGTFFILKASKKEAKKLKIHYLWKKPAYEFGLRDEPFHPLTDMKNVVSEFLENSD